MRCSRAVFLPGGRYALLSRTSCEVMRRPDPAWTGWDQKTQTEVRRREGQGWRPAETPPISLVLHSPEHDLPARCFTPESAE